MNPSSFEVERADLRKTRVVDEEPTDLDAGEALLKVDTFAITANNITYAVVGDALGYWQFFPASQDGWGRIPVWGFADVIASEAAGVDEGTRLYGYLPMATHLRVTPARVNERGFADGTAHRAELPAVYNRYRNVSDDLGSEDHQMVLWPLFATSFLIDDFFADNGFFGAGEVIVSSASSKTAIGTAFLLARRKDVTVTGLTSGGNIDFVESLGHYDRVLPYEEVESIAPAQAVFVDIAGDSGVRARLHQRFGDELRHSMLVGSTHWEDRTPPDQHLPGPPPMLFFAPNQIAKRVKDWGQAGLDERMGAAWREFSASCDDWMRIEHGAGPDAVARAYLEVLDGRSDPTIGHVLTMWGLAR